MLKEPVRQETIMAELRERIIRGALRPGARLPTRIELAEQFDTTVVTVQRALTKLSDDGFVRASRAHGTFVSDDPPHLSHYALVFETRPTSFFLWGHFWQGLVHEAMSINHGGVRTITCYYDVNGHNERGDTQKLLRDVSRGRLAGIIFSGGPNPVITHPLIEKSEIPRIVFSTPIEGVTVSTLWPDLRSFNARALEYLARRGRRAPVVLMKSSRNSHNPDCAALKVAMEKYGMRHKPKWFQFIDVYDREAPQRVVQAVMDRDQTDPPDSLIITDDTMLETATAGVAMVGRSVPNEIEIVGHSNFPWISPTSVPVTRLGFDLRAMMRLCIESLDRQRQGQGDVSHLAVAPTFEHEIQNAPAPLVAMRGANVGG
jgi:DNA-binding LacI/PurR family transcriptional regulator/DNA-binding transcriptional regulator YhcF (GntR family)